MQPTYIQVPGRGFINLSLVVSIRYAPDGRNGNIIINATGVETIHVSGISRDEWDTISKNINKLCGGVNDSDPGTVEC